MTAGRGTARALVAASVLAAFAPVHGATLVPQLPDAACAERVADGTGDAAVNWGTADQPVADPRGSADGLDITGVTVRLTATKVLVFLALKDVPDTLPATDTAHGYFVNFSRGAKIVRFEHVLANPTHTAVSTLAPTGYPKGTVGTATAPGPTLKGLGGDVDKARNVAYVYADRDSLEQLLGEPLLPGDELTAVSGRTELFLGSGALAAGVTRRPADATTVAADAATYTVGEDPCFPPSSLVAGNVATQYGDAVTLTATLTSGTALAGRPVTFGVTGETARTATTDDAGVATVTFTPRQGGTLAWTATYGGDEVSGPGHGTATLTVKPEAVRFGALKVAKPSATARTVTATLTDDDPKPLAQLRVDWYVNGRKVATVATDAAGRSVFKGAKRGQKVQARFAGVSGRYAAAKSATVTV